MDGYVLRGQGVGPMLDRVYAKYPTEAQIREALAYELERHGVVFERDADGKIVGGKPRERWVRVQSIAIDGVDMLTSPPPPGARAEMRGALDEDAIAEIVAGATKAPPGSAAADAPLYQARGTGVVVNPSDRETMTIGAEDVGTLDVSKLGG